MLRKDHHLALDLYSATGAYFITICAHQRQFLFSWVDEGQIQLKKLGALLEQRWLAVPEHHPDVILDEYVVMPNHFHAVLFLNLQAGLRLFTPEEAKSNLAVIVNSFKASVTRFARKELSWGAEPVFQKNYWDRIVRNDEELFEVRRYIQENPLKWHLDRENPHAQIQR